MSTQLGKYRLVRPLGAGGMGEVWQATDTVLDRQVAVKLLTGDAPDARQSVREAAAAAKVNHPNAVAVYDAAEVDGQWMIVMELVTGPSAAKRVTDDGPLPWAEATRIARDAAAGLAAVHAAGLVHRDVKPANVLLTPEGVAKVADFGLARASTRTTLTAVVGTPHYMSPEQCWNEAADGRADVYSLGATYYTLLTARPPFTGDTPMAVMYAHCHHPPPDPRAVCPQVPAGCAAVVRRAMAKSPAERFTSADELRAALDALLNGGSVPADDPRTVSVKLPPPTIPVAPVRAKSAVRRLLLVGVVAVLIALALTAFTCWPRPPLESGAPTTSPGAAPEPSPSPDTAPTPPATVAVPPADLPAWRDLTLTGEVQQIAISPDGTRVAVSVALKEGEGALHLLTRDGRAVDGWPRQARGVEGVAFSPDGKLLASASRGWQKVLVVDVATGEEQTVDGDHPVPGVSQVAFSPDGTRLAAGGYDSEKGMRVRFWERERSGRWKKLPGEGSAPESQLWGFAFVPGRDVVAAGLGNTAESTLATAVRLFDAVGGAELPSPGVKLTRRDVGPPLAFAADGSVLVVGSPGRVHRLKVDGWRSLDPPLTLPPDGKEKEFWAVAASPDGKWVAGGQDVSVYVWRVEDGRMRPMKKQHTDRVYTVAFTPDGKLLSGGGDGRILVHDHAAEFK